MGRIQTDNAIEVYSMKPKLENLGMTLTNSSSYTPRSNGPPQRMSRMLLEKARSMLEQAGLPTRYRGEAIQHAGGMHNRTLPKDLKMRTPMGTLLGAVPKHSRLIVFRCAAYPHIRKETPADKFAYRAENGNYF